MSEAEQSKTSIDTHALRVWELAELRAERDALRTEVAAREKAAAEKALRELREFVTRCRTANPAAASMGYDYAMFTVLEHLDATRADVLAGEGGTVSYQDRLVRAALSEMYELDDPEFATEEQKAAALRVVRTVIGVYELMRLELEAYQPRVVTPLPRPGEGER
jgi:hypothetical protein